jgi:predicted permease
MLHDLFSALRSLRRHPGFTSLAVLTLGLGIGATVTVFSLVEAILLRPLPYPQPDRLVDLAQRTVNAARLSVPRVDIPDLRRQTKIFQDVGARGLAIFDVVFQSGEGVPAHATALSVSYNYLSILGVQPVLGRTFELEDALPAAETEGEGTTPQAPAIVLTHGVWQRALGGDLDALERTFSINGRPFDIVGVLPPEFTVRNKPMHQWVSGVTADLFIAWPEEYFTYPGPRGGPGSRGVIPIGRLQPGVTYEEAQAGLEVLSAQLRNEYPSYMEEGLHYQFVPTQEELTSGYRPVLFVLTGGVLFLLLLVCANLASLMLVRGWIRSGEDAVRTAVGCGKPRLVVQKLRESLLLAFAGGAVGTGLAWVAIRVLGAIAPANILVLHQVGLDARAALVALSLAIGLVVLFGLIPVAQVRRLDLTRILGAEGRGSSGKGRRKLINALVVSELVLSVILLTGAAVMVRSLSAMTKAAHGFEGEQALTFDMSPFAQEFRSLEAMVALYSEVEERLSALPGVEAVGRSSMVPFSGRVWNGIYAPNRESIGESGEWADHIVVTDDYFRATGTRVLAGRSFTPAEMQDSTESIIVDEKLAGIAWPEEDPLGKRLIFSGGSREGVVVGVVEHMLMKDLGTESREAVYMPAQGRQGLRAASFALRTALPPESLTPSLRQALQAIHPTLVPYKVQKLSDRVALSLAPTRFVVIAMSTFAIIAVIVAMVGLFGVISYAVRTRTVELGIRMALGAEQGDIMSLVLWQGTFLSVAGILGGIIGSVVLARFMRSFVLGVSPTDPAVLIATALMVGLISVLACWAPARWACRVDPVRSLGRG